MTVLVVALDVKSHSELLQLSLHGQLDPDLVSHPISPIKRLDQVLSCGISSQLNVIKEVCTSKQCFLNRKSNLE